MVNHHHMSEKVLDRPAGRRRDRLLLLTAACLVVGIVLGYAIYHALPLDCSADPTMPCLPGPVICTAHAACRPSLVAALAGIAGGVLSAVLAVAALGRGGGFGYPEKSQ